jgi:hypothetical protein
MDTDLKLGVVPTLTEYVVYNNLRKENSVISKIAHNKRYKEDLL